MKHKLFLPLVGASLFGLMLAGCGKKEESAATEEDNSAIEATVDNDLSSDLSDDTTSTGMDTTEATTDTSGDDSDDASQEDTTLSS